MQVMVTTAPNLNRARLMLTAAGLGAHGNAAKAMEQTGHALKALEARQSGLSPEEQEAWLMLCAGALAGLGVASTAVVQADRALELLRGSERVVSKPVLKPLPRPVFESVVSRVDEPPRRVASAARTQAQVEDAIRTIDGPALPVDEPQRAEEAPRDESALVAPTLGSDSTPLAAASIAEPAAPAEPVLVEPQPDEVIVETPTETAPQLDGVDVEVATSSILDENVETTSTTTDVSQRAMQVVLLFGLPNHDDTENVVEGLLVSWPDVGTFLAAPAVTDRLTKAISHLGSGRRWDPQRRAKLIVNIATALQRHLVAGTTPTAKQFAEIPGVDRRLIDAYRLLVLDETLTQKPEDSRLAEVWESRAGAST